MKRSYAILSIILLVIISTAWLLGNRYQLHNNSGLNYRFDRLTGKTWRQRHTEPWVEICEPVNDTCSNSVISSKIEFPFRLAKPDTQSGSSALDELRRITENSEFDKLLREGERKFKIKEDEK